MKLRFFLEVSERQDAFNHNKNFAIKYSRLVIMLFFFPVVFLWSTPIAKGEAKSLNVANVSNLDNAFLPVKPTDLRAELESDSHNAIALVQLIRQGYEQNESVLTYKILKKMSAEHPHNAVLMAAYCFAIQVVSGGFVNDPNHQRETMTATASLQDEYDNGIQTAMKIDPNLWLLYTLKGNNLVRYPHTQQEGLALLKKGAELGAESSFAHYLLGLAYTLRPTPFMSVSKALKENLKAMSLRPVVSDAGVTVFWLYDSVLNERVQALEAKHNLLAVLPPGAYITPSLKQRLAAYPQ